MTETARLRNRIATLTDQIERTQDRIDRHEGNGEFAFAAGEASHLAVLIGTLSDERARLFYFEDHNG